MCVCVNIVWGDNLTRMALERVRCARPEMCFLIFCKGKGKEEEENDRFLFSFLFLKESGYCTLDLAYYVNLLLSSAVEKKSGRSCSWCLDFLFFFFLSADRSLPVDKKQNKYCKNSKCKRRHLH